MDFFSKTSSSPDFTDHVDWEMQVSFLFPWDIDDSWLQTSSILLEFNLIIIILL